MCIVIFRVIKDINHFRLRFSHFRCADVRFGSLYMHIYIHMYIHMYNVCIRSTDFRFGVTGTKCRRGFRTSSLTPLFNVLIVWGWPIKISPKMSQIPPLSISPFFPALVLTFTRFELIIQKRKRKV